MIALNADMFSLDGESLLPAHQREAIKELARFRRTKALRRLISERRFTVDECAEIVAFVKKTCTLKNTEMGGVYERE